MPSTKVTAAAITAAVVTIVIAIAGRFGVDVSEELAAGITGIVSLIVAYSSYPHLPPEVMPPAR